MANFKAKDQTELYYEDTGSGPVLFCLPGLTRNCRDFDHVTPHLAGMRLIKLDYRGRGGSGWADPTSYSVPQEAADVLALMDHLGLEKAAMLGTSRGGLVAMFLAATAKDRLSGVALNDVGPVLEAEGLAVIKTYLGLPPRQKTYEEMARARAATLTQFADVPHERWLTEARGQFEEANGALNLRYDPKLRDAFLAGEALPTPDLWPLFEALDGLPLALIRGANSDLLSATTADEMARRRPDMIRTDVPGRGHVPFLDEPEALAALKEWSQKWM